MTKINPLIIAKDTYQQLWSHRQLSVAVFTCLLFIHVVVGVFFPYIPDPITQTLRNIPLALVSGFPLCLAYDRFLKGSAANGLPEYYLNKSFRVSCYLLLIVLSSSLILGSTKLAILATMAFLSQYATLSNYLYAALAVIYPAMLYLLLIRILLGPACIVDGKPRTLKEANALVKGNILRMGASLVLSWIPVAAAGALAVVILDSVWPVQTTRISRLVEHLPTDITNSFWDLAMAACLSLWYKRLTRARTGLNCIRADDIDTHSTP